MQFVSSRTARMQSRRSVCRPEPATWPGDCRWVGSLSLLNHNWIPLLKGMFQPATLLDLVRNFIVFEKSKEDAKTGLVQVQTAKTLRRITSTMPLTKPFNRPCARFGRSGRQTRRRGLAYTRFRQESGHGVLSGKLITSARDAEPTIVVTPTETTSTISCSTPLLRPCSCCARNRSRPRAAIT